MKTQSKSLATLMAALVLVVLAGLSEAGADTDSAAFAGQEDVIKAVKASTLVQSETARVRKRINAQESSGEQIKVVTLGGSCGVAGCGFSYLAIITVHRRGVNPQSASVLAMVSRSPRGELGRVSVVELKENGHEEMKLQIQK